MQRLLTVFSTFDNVPEPCMSLKSLLEQNAERTVELLAHQENSYILQLMLPNANHCKTAAALRHKLQALLVLGSHLLTICHCTSAIGGPRAAIPTCHLRQVTKKKQIQAVRVDILLILRTKCRGVAAPWLIWYRSIATSLQET